MSEPLDFIARFCIFAVVHSLLAVPGVKQALGRRLKSRPSVYRLAYNLLSCVLFGWVMLAWQSTGVLYLVPGVWSLVLHGLQALALLAAISCLRQTGMAAFLGIDPSRGEDSPHLHTTGWYRLVRHPLYLLGMLFCLLNPVMTGRWLVLTLLSAVYFLAGALLEERRLLRTFGFAYAVYRREVPFIIPRLRRPTSVHRSA